VFGRVYISTGTRGVLWGEPPCGCISNLGGKGETLACEMFNLLHERPCNCRLQAVTRPLYMLLDRLGFNWTFPSKLVLCLRTKLRGLAYLALYALHHLIRDSRMYENVIYRGLSVTCAVQEKLSVLSCRALVGFPALFWRCGALPRASLWKAPGRCRLFGLICFCRPCKNAQIPCSDVL